MCDLAIHDPEVIEAHYENSFVLAGRHNTIFRSAFTIALPIAPAKIVRVSRPNSYQSLPLPDFSFFDLFRST